MNNVKIGIFYGVIFCLISAMFDVYVSNITQSLDPAIFIVYCFFLSSTVFIVISASKKGIINYFSKARGNIYNLMLVNLSVLLNWGGLILALKYLEPAVVGIASVACGPALTLVISRYIIKGTYSQTKPEEYISWLILFCVIIMLANSYLGNSGVTSTSHKERMAGIVCVIISAAGTVLYTFLSKRLSAKDWKPYEILGLRNILMLVAALIYTLFNQMSLAIQPEFLFIVLTLSVFGHVVPIFLIQSSISSLDPIHVSLLLLLLPVFTLLFQFLDNRIVVSYESIGVVIIITALLAVLGINKIKEKEKEKT